MDIHSTSSTDISTDPRSWRDSRAWQNLEALRPWLSWFMMIAMGVFIFYQTQRDTNAQNNVTFADLQRAQKSVEQEVSRQSVDTDKKVDALRTAMLTREVFEAYHQADMQRMERMEKMIEQLLSR